MSLGDLGYNLMRALGPRVPPPLAMSAYTHQTPAFPLLLTWSLGLTKGQIPGVVRERSSPGWGYLSHLICGQLFTVYKALPPPLPGTSSSNSNMGQAGIILLVRIMTLSPMSFSENEEVSRPQALAANSWRWG